MAGPITTTIPPPSTNPPSGTRGIKGPPTGGMTSSQQDAWAVLQQTLQAYGFSGQDLSDLVKWAKGEIIRGNSAAQITLDLYHTPQFERRFPAIGVLAHEGIAISPSEYISMEQAYAQAEHAAGLPADFASYDQLIAAQVSPSEYASRLNQGYLAVAMAPPEVIQAFHDYYGIDRAHLAAYFLNPKQQEPVLLQRAQAAQIGAAAGASGFSYQPQVNPTWTGREIAESEAMRLAQQGVTYQQAQQGFQKLREEQQLYSHLPGQGQRYTFTASGLEQAQFGADAQTALQLQIQAEYEKNTTNQGVGVQQTQQGLQGMGSVQR